MRRRLAAPLLALGLALALALPPGWLGAQGTWFDGERPAPLAHQAVALLAAAASHGLDPADYGSAALQRAVDAAARGAAAPTPAQAARLSAALDAALQRYLQHLHAGRVAPGQVHTQLRPPPRPDFDAAAALRAGMADGRLSLAVASAVPTLPVYDALRQVLAQYRALGEHPAWMQRLPALPAPARRGAAAALEPGQPWSGLDLLVQRLHLLGDLAPAGAAVPTAPAAAPAAPPLASAAAAASAPPVWARAPEALYGGALVEAVQAFQRRHGLTPDGRIGRATLAALQRSPAQRVRQIELTLERLRWTPLLQSPRMVVINVPEFVLRAYEVHDNRVSLQLQMKVIVGRAQRNRTPLFGEPMRRIEFSPYWNVPASIARAELVPHLRRSPGLFDAAGYEFVTAAGAVVPQLQPELLDAVLAGRARIRQRPGPKNALGDIKFVFPNTDAIYLHHTPSVALFERDRRDFSHGCIRVQDPVALAAFVLAHQPGWPEPRIRQAMSAGRSTLLELAEPLPVLITYATALVLHGQPHFFDDLYGYDELLQRALQQRRLPNLPSPT